MDTDEIIGGRIGEALVRQGDMTVEQVDHILELQKNGDGRLFGEIAVDLGYIDLDVVIRFLEADDREKS
ncbi:MAG: hypothetical protein JXB03_04690 [Spirochaetales bacterium]|nr:hypothetical protein [Spirochaetales bacterium]